jgi:hypothetical protein
MGLCGSFACLYKARPVNEAAASPASNSMRISASTAFHRSSFTSPLPDGRAAVRLPGDSLLGILARSFGLPRDCRTAPASSEEAEEARLCGGGEAHGAKCEILRAAVRASETRATPSATSALNPNRPLCPREKNGSRNTVHNHSRTHAPRARAHTHTHAPRPQTR